MSVPADLGQLNCAALVAGIIAGVLDGASFVSACPRHVEARMGRDLQNYCSSLVPMRRPLSKCARENVSVLWKAVSIASGYMCSLATGRRLRCTVVGETGISSATALQASKS